jgi:hypothetical protein
MREIELGGAKAAGRTALAGDAETVVTTTMFSEAEQAAWRVAVDRGLSITAADLRRMLEAAAPYIGAT